MGLGLGLGVGLGLGFGLGVGVTSRESDHSICFLTAASQMESRSSACCAALLPRSSTSRTSCTTAPARRIAGLSAAELARLRSRAAAVSDACGGVLAASIMTTAGTAPASSSHSAARRALGPLQPR